MDLAHVSLLLNLSGESPLERLNSGIKVNGSLLRPT